MVWFFCDVAPVEMVNQSNAQLHSIRKAGAWGTGGLAAEKGRGRAFPAPELSN